jgi:hypothetical protein
MMKDTSKMNIEIGSDETVVNLTPTENHKNADAENAAAQMKKFMLEAQVKGIDIQVLIREGRA